MNLCPQLLFAAVFAFGASFNAYSQESPDEPGKNSEMEDVVVTADGSQVELTGAYSGSQVARGGRTAGARGSFSRSQCVYQRCGPWR